MLKIKKNLVTRVTSGMVFLGVSGCAPSLVTTKETTDLPQNLPKIFPPSIQLPGAAPGASKNEKAIPVTSSWRALFLDENLSKMLNEALKNNQELNIVTQEISIASNEIMARRGEYIPKVDAGAGAGIEKVGDYTSQGVSDATSEYEPGKRVPENLPMYSLGLRLSWEVDIWKRLRNATRSAALQYFATVEGRNFAITRISAEIAITYYELLALDNQLEILQKNIKFQEEALELVRAQKQAAKVTKLAVKRFEAEVLKNKGKRFEFQQKLVQTENKLNALMGRLPQRIERQSDGFLQRSLPSIQSGVPSKLLSRRTDVKRAEFRLEASKLDVKVARARFYPSFSIEAGAGYESFNTNHLIQSPESVFYNVAGNLTAPFLNRMAIKAQYFSANSKQIQALYDYEKSVINAYTEVVNQLSMIQNMQKTFEIKTRQVEALTEASETSSILFKAARADYVEVLMTKRDALESQMELVEVKKELMAAYVNLYQALGGGWEGG